MNSLAQLPFLPLSLAVLAEAKFFLSSDARIIRAGLWMLEAAWRSSQPGSIPVGFESLAATTRLTNEQLHDNYDLLTDGWQLHDDGRLHFAPLELIANSVQERFGAQLEVIADSAMIACQGGASVFELLPPLEVKKKQKGKHALPKDFMMDRDSLELSCAEGYDTEDARAWLMQQFKDYAMSKDVRQANWQAALRNFLGSSITRQTFRAKFGYPLGQRPSVELAVMPSQPAQRLTPAQRINRLNNSDANKTESKTFAQMASSHNSNLMAQALERQMRHQQQPGMST